MGFSVTSRTCRSRLALSTARSGVCATVSAAFVPPPDGHAQHVIRRSIAVVVADVDEQTARTLRSHRARERSGGVASLRHAIRSQIRLLAQSWPPTWRGCRCSPRGAPTTCRCSRPSSSGGGLGRGRAGRRLAEDADVVHEIASVAERQLRLITLGVPQWRSQHQMAHRSLAERSAAAARPIWP